MNKFVEYIDAIYEIRPDLKWRWITSLYPINVSPEDWREDDPTYYEEGWKDLIENGTAKVIDIEKWMEENFEHML
jgi:hypothetical protein